ncbi:hypothetical protein ABK040_007265 [Willaertia magna]
MYNNNNNATSFGVSNLFRFHIFPNGDYKRQYGKVMLFTPSSNDLNTITSQLFLQSYQFIFPEESLNNTYNNNKIRIFTKEGSEIYSFIQLKDDDVLFIEKNGNSFQNIIQQYNDCKEVFFVNNLQNLQHFNSSSLLDLCSGNINNEHFTINNNNNELNSVMIGNNSLMMDENVVSNHFSIVIKNCNQPLNNCNNNLLNELKFNFERKNNQFILLNKNNEIVNQINDLKTLILKEEEFKKILFNNYSINNKNDLFLVFKGKELLDKTELQSLFLNNNKDYNNDYNKDYNNTIIIYLTLKPFKLFVKLMMESGRVVIIDNPELINYHSTFLDVKNYIEKRLGTFNNNLFEGKDLTFLFDQKRITNLSEKIGNVVYSGATLHATYI